MAMIYIDASELTELTIVYSAKGWIIEPMGRRNDYRRNKSLLP
jgi:hypothetical protein